MLWFTSLLAHFTGKLVERTMMRRYGVENVNDHFISFNTICDATQVFSLLHSIGFVFFMTMICLWSIIVEHLIVCWRVFDFIIKFLRHLSVFLPLFMFRYRNLACGHYFWHICIKELFVLLMLYLDQVFREGFVEEKENR